MTAWVRSARGRSAMKGRRSATFSGCHVPDVTPRCHDGFVSDTRVLLCDLDGVVWRRSEPVQGSIAALGDLIGAGWSVLFITNSSHDPAGHHLDRLLELGVPDGVDVLTSPMAPTKYLYASAAQTDHAPAFAKRRDAMTDCQC